MKLEERKGRQREITIRWIGCQILLNADIGLAASLLSWPSVFLSLKDRRDKGRSVAAKIIMRLRDQERVP